MRRGQEAAALVWLKEQEDAGIDIVSDGEQFRIHFVHGILEHVGGIDWELKTPMGASKPASEKRAADRSLGA